MNKGLKLILFLLMLPLAIVSAAGKKPIGEKQMSAYLMVFHRDDTHSLYMALSRDGYQFTALNNAQPVISGDTIAERVVCATRIYTADPMVPSILPPPTCTSMHNARANALPSGSVMVPYTVGATTADWCS